jgi:hypothetical protein
VDNLDEQRDFFVSYTQADRAWAEWLAWELEAAGYTTLLQVWGHARRDRVRARHGPGHPARRRTILVLSPAYLRSQMAEAEWRPGFKADPSGRARRLLPVRVEDCEPTGLLADRVWIDLMGLDEATARGRLREEVARALRGPGRPTTPPRFPRAPAAAEAPNFTGRDELLGRWPRRSPAAELRQSPRSCKVVVGSARLPWRWSTPTGIASASRPSGGCGPISRPLCSAT